MPGSLQSKQNLIKINRDDDTRSLLGNKAHRIGPVTLLTRGKGTFNPVQCCQYSDLSYVDFVSGLHNCLEFSHNFLENYNAGKDFKNIHFTE